MTVPSFFTRVERFFFFHAHKFSKFEICVFAGEATPVPNPFELPGERYEILLFCRQAKGTEPDCEHAISVAEKAGFVNVELKRSAALERRPNRRTVSPESRKAYRLALREGNALVAYFPEDPVVFCPVGI